MCKICSYSNHDSSSRPYYISNDGFSRLISITETMTEQQVEFVSKMQEYDMSLTLGLVILTFMFICVMMVCLSLLYSPR